MITPPTERRNGIGILSAFAAFALLALFVYLMVVAESILQPLAVAIFIVILLDALAARISMVRIGGYQSPAWLSMTLSIVLFLGAFVALGSLIRSNIAAVSSALPAYEANFSALAERAVVLLQLDEVPTIQDLRNQIDIQSILSATVATLAAFTGNTLTVMFYVAFILLEQVTFGKKLKNLFQKKDDHRRVIDMLTRITRDIQTYLGLKTLMSLITGGLSYGVMAVLGVDFAEFWAVLIFVLNFIPYVGSLIGVAFPAMLTLVQFETITPFVITTIVLALLQLAVGNILEPRMMGRSLNLSPLIIMLSLAVFGQIWGIMGMILSMPLMVILLIVCAGFETTKPIAVLLSANGEIARAPDDTRDGTADGTADKLADALADEPVESASDEGPR